MGDISGFSIPPPSPPPQLSPKSNLPMLYYGLVVVGTAAIVLAIYNLIIIRWCANRQSRSRQGGSLMEISASQNFENANSNLLSSFQYKKGNSNTGPQEQAAVDYECAVCLSVFEDGEEVRRLPRCNHSFHAPCIDMWLYSHFDCPLCRAPVDPSPLCRQHTVVNTPENSREGLLDSVIPV